MREGDALQPSLTIVVYAAEYQRRADRTAGCAERLVVFLQKLE